MSVELNVDLGELADEPEALYALATVVNIACGGHAGDDASMERALLLARHHGARVAAHPSYADREGFGRRAHFALPIDAARAVAQQCASLARHAAATNITIEILKLHGALYHDAAADEALASAIVDAARFALPALETVVGPPRSMIERCARHRNLRFDAEGFADRRYTDQGQLAPRSEPGALLVDPASCVAQALRLAKSGAFATLCMHGDTPGAELLAGAVHGALVEAGLLRARPDRSGASS